MKEETRVCEICNNSFLYFGKSKRRTCSEKCYGKLLSKIFNKKVSKPCEICGKNILMSIARLKLRRTCSRECGAKLKSLQTKGKKKSDTTRQKMSISARRENIIKYGNFICKKCNKGFETNTSLRAHTSYCNAQNTDNEIKECLLCGKRLTRRGLLVHMKLVHGNIQEREARISKISIFHRTRKLTSKSISKKEIEFFNKISLIFKDAVHDFKISELSHTYDIYIPSLNTIIEYDGDYWHGNKGIHVLSSRMKQQYHIDKRYSLNAIGNGYVLVRVWESESEKFLEELKRNFDDGLNTCKDFINSKKWRKENI